MVRKMKILTFFCSNSASNKASFDESNTNSTDQGLRNPDSSIISYPVPAEIPDPAAPIACQQI